MALVQPLRTETLEVLATHRIGLADALEYAVLSEGGVCIDEFFRPLARCCRFEGSAPSAEGLRH
jgi:hypothetical protein